jgi:hypothetical protein
MPDADKCTLCERTMREHKAAEEAGEVHHKFAGPGQGLSHVSGEKIPSKGDLPAPKIVSGPPFDPILRTILIEKGVISVEDLEKAEKLLQATGVIRNHGHPQH